jgi:hypothetical protein
MTDTVGVWVYAITDCGVEVDGLASGVGGAPVRAVGIGGTGLVALVSDVELAEFGEAALRRNLEDLAWLEETARAHHRVIEAAARLFPLLPARLATVYNSDANMVAAFSARGAGLRAALERVRERSEWGVKAYAEPRQPSAEKTSAGPQPERKTGTGVAYLRRRRDELSAREDSQRATLTSAQAVHSELATYAARARLHPPQAPQLSGAKTPMILNAAYLLDDSRAEVFASAVAELSEEHPHLRLELTGPWPPYSFADGGEGADEESGNQESGDQESGDEEGGA